MIAFSPDSCVLFAASSDDTGGRRPAAGASSSLAGTASPLPLAAAGFAAAEDASPLSPTKVSSLLVSSSGALRPESDERKKENPKRLEGGKKGRNGGKTSLFYQVLGFACSGAGRWEYGAHEAGQFAPHGRANTATQSRNNRRCLAGGVYLAPKRKPCRRLCRAPRPCSPPRTWTARPGPARPNLNGKKVVRSGQVVD